MTGRRPSRRRVVPAAVVLVALIALAACASGSTSTGAPGATPTTTPRSTAPSPTTARPSAGATPVSTARLRTVARDLRTTCRSEGAVVGVSGPDGRHRVVASGRFAPGVELTPDSQYFAGSVTKLLVATVVLQLVDEGELAPDDTVDEFLDWPRGDEITVELREVSIPRRTIYVELAAEARRALEATVRPRLSGRDRKGPVRPTPARTPMRKKGKHGGRRK